MSYLVLARKWRPTTFDEVVGQDAVVRTLKNAIQMQRVHHAYLFTGARGVGKTTVARILAKALNCESGPTVTPDNTCSLCQEITRGGSPDVFEIDGASNTGVDDVRQLRENSQYLPARSRYKIYIIDEVHMLSTSAFNALLKTLEEPPAHVKFIFATTEPHKIPVTVLSRCQRFDFKRVPSEVLAGHLRKILGQEGAQVDEEALRLLAREAGGSVRDSLSLSDQVLAFGSQHIGVTEVRAALGLPTGELYAEVIDFVLDKAADPLLQAIGRLFEDGHDLKRFSEGLLGHVHQMILIQGLKDPKALLSDHMPEEIERLKSQAQRAGTLRWQQIFDILARAAEDLQRHPHPRWILEVALLRLIALEEAVGLDELIGRVEVLALAVGNGAPLPPTRPRPETFAPASRESRPVRSPAAARPPQPAEAARSPSPPTPAEAPRLAEPVPTPGKDWSAFVQFVSKRKPSLGSVLLHAVPLEANAERVRLALEPNSFFAEALRETPNRNTLTQYCREFFGGTPELSVVEEHSQLGGLTLAREKELAQEEASVKMHEQAIAHPLVQEAVRLFGAKVEQVLPGSSPSENGEG